MLKTARYLVLVVALLAPLGSSAAGDDYAKLRANVEAFRQDKSKRQFRHHYEKHIAALRMYAAQNSDSDRADDALYVAAQLFDELYTASYVSKDLASAVNAYDELAQRYPTSNLTDDALFRMARIKLEHLGDREGAREALSRITQMDRADFKPKARELLARLPAATASASGDGEAAAPPTVKGALDALVAKTDETAEVTPNATAKRPAPGMVLESDTKKTRRLKKAALAGKKTQRDLVLKLSGDVNARLGEAPKTDTKPRRVFFDLYPLTAPRALTRLSAKTDVAGGIRIAQYDEKTVRVVVEVQGDFTPVLEWNAKKRALRIPLHEAVAAPKAPAVAAADTEAPAPDANKPSADDEKVAAATPAPVTPPPAKPVTADTVKKRLGTVGAPGGVSISQQMGLSVARIVVDAGHGGKDTGALGPSGLREKDVTLAIAKLVKKKLNKRLPGVEVILTRDTDDFVELKDRTDIANGKKADLFISIHANANPSRRVHGVETYYLNITHDRYAMRLAARENRETAGDHKISDLEFILADLAMKSNVDDSIRLGRHVQQSLVGNLRKDYKNVQDLGLKHALFYVLLGSHMPAILVETSFVSNRMEEKRLKSNKYRDDVAEGIVRGVQRFVEERQAFAQR